MPSFARTHALVARAILSFFFLCVPFVSLAFGSAIYTYRRVVIEVRGSSSLSLFLPFSSRPPLLLLRSLSFPLFLFSLAAVWSALAQLVGIHFRGRCSAALARTVAALLRSRRFGRRGCFVCVVSSFRSFRLSSFPSFPRALLCGSLFHSSSEFRQLARSCGVATECTEPLSASRRRPFRVSLAGRG